MWQELLLCEVTYTAPATFWIKQDESDKIKLFCVKHNYSDNYLNRPFHFGCEDKVLKDLPAKNSI